MCDARWQSRASIAEWSTNVCDHHWSPRIRWLIMPMMRRDWWLSAVVPRVGWCFGMLARRRQRCDNKQSRRGFSAPCARPPAVDYIFDRIRLRRLLLSGNPPRSGIVQYGQRILVRVDLGDGKNVHEIRFMLKKSKVLVRNVLSEEKEMCAILSKNLFDFFFSMKFELD